MPAIIPSNPSAELYAALRWIEGFNSWDIDKVLSVAADDYTHHLLPQSLGRPPQGKEQFREYFKQVLPMFVGFTVTIHDILESPGKVFFHATSTATSTTGYPYANEYTIMLYLKTQPDGMPKISVAKEFVDSKYNMEFFTAERNRQAAKHLEQTLG